MIPVSQLRNLLIEANRFLRVLHLGSSNPANGKGFSAFAHAIVFLFLMASASVAETSDELLDQLMRVLRSMANEPGTRVDPSVKPMLEQWGLIQFYYVDGRIKEDAEPWLLKVIQSIETASRSEKIKDLCHTLGMQLWTTIEAKDAAKAETYRKGIADAIRAGLAAKTIQDLDEPQSAIRRLSADSYYNPDPTSKLYALRGNTDSALIYLHYLQNLLAHINPNDRVVAPWAWRNLVNPMNEISAFPPKEELVVLAEDLRKRLGIRLENPLPEGPERLLQIVTEIKSLDDLAKAIPSMEEISYFGLLNGNQGHDLADFLHDLHNLERTYRELRRGLATSFDLMSHSLQAPYNGIDLDLRDQLILLALPRLLLLPDSEGVRSDEKAWSYLQRVADQAHATSNWPLLVRTIDVARSLEFTLTFRRTDSTALRLFLAGSNQERAGQYVFAAVSYQEELATGSQVISPEFIRDRLEALRKTHPEEFEQGRSQAWNARRPNSEYVAGGFVWFPRSVGLPPTFVQPGIYPKPEQITSIAVPPRQDAASPPNTPAVPVATKVK